MHMELRLISFSPGKEQKFLLELPLSSPFCNRRIWATKRFPSHVCQLGLILGVLNLENDRALVICRREIKIKRDLCVCTPSADISMPEHRDE